MGDFTSFNGTGRNRVARLNSDGTLDTAFNSGSGANFLVTSAALQSDGKDPSSAVTSMTTTARLVVALAQVER